MANKLSSDSEQLFGFIFTQKPNTDSNRKAMAQYNSVGGSISEPDDVESNRIDTA